MITLFLGGANSGKSRLAERYAAGRPEPVTYVATWRRSADPAMQERVAAHRARRPENWRLVEAPDDLAGAVRPLDGTVLIDALGTWVAGAPDFAVDASGLCGALSGRAGDTVIVSDEVGLGVHPSTAAGRAFREALGPLNEAVAAVSDEVWWVAAGHVTRLDRAPW